MAGPVSLTDSWSNPNHFPLRDNQPVVAPLYRNCCEAPLLLRRRAALLIAGTLDVPGTVNNGHPASHKTNVVDDPSYLTAAISRGKCACVEFLDLLPSGGSVAVWAQEITIFRPQSC